MKIYVFRMSDGTHVIVKAFGLTEARSIVAREFPELKAEHLGSAKEFLSIRIA